MKKLGLKFFPSGRGGRGASMGAGGDRRVALGVVRGWRGRGKHWCTASCSVDATTSRGTPAICLPTLSPNGPWSQISERAREAGGRTGNVCFGGGTWPLFGLSGPGVSCAKTYRRGTGDSTTTFDIRAACEATRLVRGIGGVAEQTCESGLLVARRHSVEV